jgi:hypothetical protein
MRLVEFIQLLPDDVSITNENGKLFLRRNDI